MTPDLSVIVVSFNTRELLRECLTTLYAEVEGIPTEVFVVDSASRDGSAEMVERDFPAVLLIRGDVNLGFAGANNKAFPLARGRYVVLLNSDAFPRPRAIRRAIEHMDAEPEVAVGGAMLIGRDGSWQPSARMFPSLLNDFLTASGLAAKFPKSRFLGRQDNTWADHNQPMDTDWVPGAFSILRRGVLDVVGYFDERFFLYYEEVDLCRRIKRAGHVVRYWPDVVIVHLGGESSKTMKDQRISRSGSQLELWRMRSGFLYYRKHHGWTAWLWKWMEKMRHYARSWKNNLGSRPEQNEKVEESRVVIRLLDQAWRETSGGETSPSRPW